MMSPDAFIQCVKNESYTNLMQRRENLLMAIHQFERDIMRGDRGDPSRSCHPSPDVRYRMNLEYLSRLCSLMHEKYHQEYVWSGYTLKEE